MRGYIRGHEEFTTAKLHHIETMSDQSDLAEIVHDRLTAGPVPIAELVRELRIRWGTDHRVPAVHGFLCEVATCLLRRGDIEVGDVTDGRFVSWSIDPWDADARIYAELMAMETFLQDDCRYVFRRKFPN